MSGHEHWEQLAAAYALDALEPEEHAEFVRHLDTCAQCRQLVDEHSLVAAQLGSLAGDDVSPPPWSAIRAGVVGSSRRVDDAEVVVLRRRPPLAAMAAAAAAVVLIAAGVAAWQLTRGDNGARPLASATACGQTTGCHVIALGSGTGPRADVLVHDGRVAIVPTSMPSAPSGSVWALWQLPRSGAPMLLTEFAAGRHTAQLKLRYGDTAGFAVSREPAGSTPVTPTVVVASGTTG